MSFRTKRCHWYDDDGRPRANKYGKRGCDVPHCTFFHPSDPQWATAISTRPPLRLVSEDERAILCKERSSPPPRTSSTSNAPPQRRQDSEPSLRRRDTDTTMRDRSPPLGPRRRDTTEAFNRDRSPLGVRRRDTDISMRDRSPLGSTAPLDSRDRGRTEQGSFRRSVDKDVKNDSRDREISASSSSSSLAPPPPPALKPSPPAAAGIKEPTKEDKINVWVQRIKSLADAVTLRIDYVKLEREVQGYRQMNNSKRLIDISEQTKARLNTQLTDLETQWNGKKDELNKAVFRLIDTDYWPVAQQIPDTSSPEERFRDLRVTVWELRDNVKKLFEMLKAANVRASSTAPTVVGDDLAASEEPPTKRRKVAENEAVKIQHIPAPPPAIPPAPPVTSSVPPAAAPSLPPPPPNSDELTVVNSRFSELETRLDDLENSMVQVDNDLLMQLDDRIEEKLAEASARTAAAAAAQPPVQPSLADTGQDVVNGKLAELQTYTKNLGSDVEDLAKEVAGLINKTDDTNLEIEKLKAENETMKKQIAVLEEQQKLNSEALKSQREELTALSEALTTYVGQPPAPAPPASIDLGVLLESVGPPLLDAVRQDIQPLFAELRTQMEQMLAAQSTELSTTVVAKLSTTLRIVQGIQSWMDHLLAQQTAPPVVHQRGGPLSISNGVREKSMVPSFNGDRVLSNKPP